MRKASLVHNVIVVDLQLKLYHGMTTCRVGRFVRFALRNLFARFAIPQHAVFNVNHVSSTCIEST